ncbi:MAG: hypothetical protein ACU4EP_12850 [Candidatus Nitrosoglobus sp.]
MPLVGRIPSVAPLLIEYGDGDVNVASAGQSQKTVHRVGRERKIFSEPLEA